jgi:hypothetical protein
MTRRAVRVELGGNTATISGPQLRTALQLAGCRWMWHPTRHHTAVQVPLADVDDVIAAFEHDGQHVEVLDRDGRPVPHGGLLGGVA